LNTGLLYRNLIQIIEETIEGTVISLLASVGAVYAKYQDEHLRNSIGVTPAMAAGISNHIWTIEEIVKLAE